jgi:uncharacterized RDD family membrane protein YckC
VNVPADERPVFAVELTRVTGRRAVAHVVDGLVEGLLFLVVVVPATQISEVVGIVLTLVAVFVGQPAYFVLTQRHNGQSPGKKLTGIRVVDRCGLVPSSSALIRRSVPLIFEYFYVIAFISIISSDYRQRLGDRWAGTYVVGATDSRS